MNGFGICYNDIAFLCVIICTERVIFIKKSMNAWTVNRETGFEDMFRQLKDAGFEGIELNIDKEDSSAHSLYMSTDAKRLSELKYLSEQYSLPVVSISTSLYGGKLGSPDKAVRTEAQALLIKQLDCAAAFGADGILVVPGSTSGSGVSLLDAWKYSVEAMTELKGEIDARKIYVGVENVWNEFFTSPFDMCKFIDELGSAYVGAYYDVGNVVAFSTSENWIEVLGGRIKKIHFKDFKRASHLNSGGTWEDITKGSIRWDKVIAALHKAGFDGYLTAEVFKQNETQSFTDYYAEVSKQLGDVLSMLN